MSVTKIVLTSTGALALTAAVATAAYFRGKAQGIRAASAGATAHAAGAVSPRPAEVRA